MRRGVATATAQELCHYRYYHSSRADLLHRAGRDNEARRAYSRAIALAQTEAERRGLQERLAQLARSD